MSGAQVTITIDDAELRRALRRMLGDLANPTPALREIGEVVRNSTRARFKTETDPEGKPWAPNSDMSLMRYLEQRSGSFKKKTATGGQSLTQTGIKRIAGKKVLTNRGHLADTLAYRLQDGGRAVAVGSNRVYAAMQQFGGTRAQWPHLWGDIPARPFLGLSEADRDEVVTILRDHLSR
jgi:phage virion morphogenesis protein